MLTDDDLYIISEIIETETIEEHIKVLSKLSRKDILEVFACARMKEIAADKRAERRRKQLSIVEHNL